MKYSKMILSMVLLIGFVMTSVPFHSEQTFKIGSGGDDPFYSSSTMIIRLPYETDIIDYISTNNLDVIGTHPNQWIDVEITKDTENQLEYQDIAYEVRIENVQEHKNMVRGDYHSLDEMESELEDISSLHPDITTLYSIGSTYENRDIWCLEITDNPGVDEDEPEVFFMGLHHAREWPSLEICMYIAETMTENYGSDTTITNLVNNRRLFLVPCVNPDGYHWDHDLGHDSRKNRHYFPEFGTYGVDLNRNYGGSSDGNPLGAWGSIGEGSVSHNPSNSLYCGPDSMSELEVQAIKNMFLQHNISACITWHTYSELVLWPWGYSTSEITPDDTYMSTVGTEIASRITSQSGYDTYTPDQSSGLYPTTGDTTDWSYGYSHYVLGKQTFSYTIEACSQFSPPATYLDQICEENFDGALYLLEEAENISMLNPRVLPPAFNETIVDSNGNYQISWIQQNPNAEATLYQVDELSDLEIKTDDAESITQLWDLDGFSITATNSHSGNSCFLSNYENEDVSSMTTLYPVPVTAGMNLSFYCSFDIESNYDMAMVEVSTDGRYFDVLDTFNGFEDEWILKEYSLADYENSSIYIRFRYTTDASQLESGFYVDDIYPVANFSSITTLSDSLTTTNHTMTNKSSGSYYYRIRGFNSVHGWGDFSPLHNVTVEKSINADFVWTPENPTIYDFVSFTDVSTDSNGTILNWTWDFGDGTVSYDQHPMHRYSNVGEYLVTLSVADDQGRFDSITKLISIESTMSVIAELENGWNCISMPVNQTINITQLFINYDNTNYTWSEAWNVGLLEPSVFLFNVTSQSYEYIIGNDLLLSPGIGYWFYAYDSMTLIGENITGFQWDGQISPLVSGWNNIGVPFDEPITLGEILIEFNGIDYTWSEAWNAGFVEPSVFHFDPVQQQYIYLIGDAAILNPGQGYWFFSYQSLMLKTES